MYNVGQILYCIIESHFKVIPIKVIEKVSIENLEGSTTEFFVQLPDTEEFKKVSLKKFKKVFVSLDEVKIDLLENANKSIIKMIDDANELKSKVFNEKLEIKNAFEEKNEKVSIKLQDGFVGKISLKEFKDFTGSDIEQDTAN